MQVIERWAIFAIPLTGSLLLRRMAALGAALLRAGGLVGGVHNVSPFKIFVMKNIKKRIFAMVIFVTILLMGYYAKATITCYDYGDCVVCIDTNAAYHPMGGCVSGEGCIARSEICGY